MNPFHHPAFTRTRDRLRSELRGRVLRFEHLRPIIFLCGARNSEQRLDLRAYVQRHHQDHFVFFAEDVWAEVAKRKDLNALEMEEQLARLSDLIIILVESPGTFAELGAFAVSPELRPKLLPVIPRRFRGEESFINTGPVSWVNQSSRFADAIYSDFAALLADSAGDLSERVGRIPKRGPLAGPIRDLRPAERPKHLLFLLCDLLAILGPANEAFCGDMLESLLESKPAWHIGSLLALAESLGLVESLAPEAEAPFYVRRLVDGRMESFQRPGAIDLAGWRMKVLSSYQKIPELRSVLRTVAAPA